MAALSNASLYVLLNVLLVIQTTVGGIPIRSGLYEDHDYLSLPNNAEPPCSCSPNNTQRRNETEDNYQPMQDDRRRLRADPPSIPDIEPMQDDSSRLMADPPSIPDIEMEEVLLEEIAPEDLDNVTASPGDNDPYGCNLMGVCLEPGRACENKICRRFPWATCRLFCSGCLDRFFLYGIDITDFCGN